MTPATVLVHPGGTDVTIVITGEIDLANADVVSEQLAAAIPNRMTGVRLDLTGLDYIDSAGLRILFALATRLDVLQIELQVIAPPGSLTRRVLELSGFEAVVTLAPPRPASSP